jgi:hypothetical protein
VQLGLWVNLAKNPRQRAVEMQPLHFLVDLPKSLHLASVAVRLTHLHYDEFTAHAMNEYMVSHMHYDELTAHVLNEYMVSYMHYDELTAHAMNEYMVSSTASYLYYCCEIILIFNRCVPVKIHLMNSYL